jgi:hypothetical protein
MSANKLISRESLNTLNNHLFELFMDTSFKKINAMVEELKAGIHDESMASILEDLELALKCKTEAIKSKIDLIIQFYQEEIFNKDHDSLNDLKKVIYKLMKDSTPGSEENKYFYKMYQDIKEGNMDITEASNLLIEAMQKILENK